MKEYYREDQVQARKRHACELCGRSILPGRQYVYLTATREGRRVHEKRHIHCHLLAVAASESLEGVAEEPMMAIFRYVCLRQCPDGQAEVCAAEPSRIFACAKTIKQLLEPNLVGAALDSVRDNEE